MCRAVVYHCETPMAESRRLSNPLPQAGHGDRGEPSADGASSVSRLSSTSNEEVEQTLEVGLALAPIPDARRRPRLLTRPCWEGAVPEQVQPQPLYPLCQHLGGGARALFLSSLLLIHTLKRCCGITSSPLPPPCNESRHQKSQTRQFSNKWTYNPVAFRLLLQRNSIRKHRVHRTADPRRADCTVVLTQGFFLRRPRSALQLTSPQPGSRHNHSPISHCFITSSCKTKRFCSVPGCSRHPA